MPQDMQRILNQVSELWNTGRAELAAELYDTNAEYHGPAGTIHGLQQITGYLASLHRGFPDFKLDIKQTLVESDHIAIRWTCTGTHKGEFQGIPATGKRVEIDGMTTGEIKNGKIAQEYVFFDQLSMLQQMGLAPASTQAGAVGAAS